MQKVQKPSLVRPKQSLEKIVVNVGIGRFANQPNFDDKILPELIKDVALMTGQRPATRPAKQSVAGFKIRSGNVVGLKVTLRGKRMTDFLNKLNQVVLPRIRDFRGLDLKSLDSGGNLSIGMREHTTFPEIIPELTKHDLGVEITLVPKDVNKERAVQLYRDLGVPLKRDSKNLNI